MSPAGWRGQGKGKWDMGEMGSGKRPRKRVGCLGILAVSLAVSLLGCAYGGTSGPSGPGGDTEEVVVEGTETGDVPQTGWTDLDSSQRTVDTAAIDALLLSKIPQSYQESKWFLGYSGEASDGTVAISLQFDQGFDDTDAAFALAQEYYAVARAAAEEGGAELETYDMAVVNGGAPVGIYVTHDGVRYTLMKDGKRTELQAGESVQQEAADRPDDEGTDTSGDVTYVLNTNSKKFHRPDCGLVDRISPSNRMDVTGTRDEVIQMGYEACPSCDP